jgi:hypothetical protein
VRLTEAGKVRILTPPDPRTGGTELELDPLEWIHQVVQQIPASRQHLTRYYGAYANRRRRKLRAAWSAVAEGERGAAEAQLAPQNAHPHEQPNAPAPSVATEQTPQTPSEEPPPSNGVPLELGTAPAQDLRGRSAPVPAVPDGDEGRQRDHRAGGDRRDPLAHPPEGWTRPVRGSRAAGDRPPCGRHGRVGGGRACRVTCELGDRMPGAEPTQITVEGVSSLPSRTEEERPGAGFRGQGALE